MDVADRFRPRSGACFRCRHLRLSGEASQPGFHAPAGALLPDPARTPLRFGCIRPSTARSASRFRGIVGLAPRVLPLTPQVAFHLIRTTPFATPPVRFGSYCALAVIPGPFSRSLPLGTLNPRMSVSFFPTRLRHRAVAAAIFRFVQNRRITDPALAHSSNYRFSSTVFTPGPETNGTRGVTRFAAG